MSLDNRMPSTKSELPTIKDEELSASLDGRGNLNPSRKSAFSPHEQASPQKRDNSSNGYHDSSTSKPASKSSSKASSPHEQSSPQPRDTSFKVLGDTKSASRSSSNTSSSSHHELLQEERLVTLNYGFEIH